MLGPVFAWELVRTGRRRWHWFARVLYVGLLLVFLYATFGDVTQFAGSRQNHQILAEIGARFYRAFSFYQLLAVLVLSPIYAASSVSEEKTRRTLPYLLASRLRDDEIVLGKIALAVLRVWEILLCGLPLCAMCLLLGGVTPEFMALDFLVAMAAAWASCALGVLVAILSRRLSEGLLLVLLVQLIWYILPAIDAVARAAATGFSVPRALLEMNAFTAIYRGQLAGAINRWDSYTACLAATLACGLIWSLSAWWILRPAWRREEQRGAPRSLLERWRRPRAAQCVWDQPWLWRELRSRRSGPVDRVVWALYLAISVGMLASIAVHWEASVAALAAGPMTGIPPTSFLIAVYGQFLYMAVLALPYLTILGATAFAEERDGGHLDLLCITLLDQRDLVQAKAARLALAGAWIVALPIVLEGLILAVGWGTWWALVLTSLHCLAAAAFWLALGMAFSLRMAKTSQALIAALTLVLVFMAAGPTIAALFSNDINMLAISSTPMHCIFLQVADNLKQPYHDRNGLTVESVRVISLLYTIAYALGALGMYCWALWPAGPWREASALWLSNTATVSRPAPLAAKTLPRHLSEW